jgi:hypothetical protein
LKAAIHTPRNEKVAYTIYIEYILVEKYKEPKKRVQQ